MKAEFYISFTASRDTLGRVSRVYAQKLTQGRPETPAELCLKFEVDLPTEMFDPATVSVEIKAPSDAITALQKTVTELS